MLNILDQSPPFTCTIHKFTLALLELMFCLCLKSSFVLRNVTGWGVNGEAEQLVLDLMGIHGGPCSISSGHVWMWELGYKEGWVPKNWCFWTVMLEKTLESPLDCKDIQPVHPKGNQSWILTGRTDAEAETPILWTPDAKNWLIWKDPDAGKDWRKEEKGTTEDEMVGGHHQLNGHEFGWTPWVGDRQGGLACCSPWGHKESDTTEQLNRTELEV